MGKGGKKEAKGEKAGLLETNGALTPKFTDVLREVFGRFDIDRDGALSLAELEAFANASKSGEKIDEAELKQLGTFFEVNESGFLTCKGFEQMYAMQCGQAPADVWRDLKNLGYQRSLDLLGTSAPAAAPPAEPAVELRAALMALQEQGESAAAHRRVGKALQAMGREEAAARSFKQADECAASAPAEQQPSTVEDLD